MAKFKDRIFSGMRPTGKLHVGHYFGVLINYLELQKANDCFFMVADYHAMTSAELSKLQLAENSREMLLDWLAVGVDPEKATVFVQSAVPQHAELYLIMSMLAPTGWLERNPTYKEQVAELGEKLTSSLGFLGYPVLQSVDICLYKGTRVPVGEDQKPHLELGRELIRRFNSTFKKEVFPEFQPLLTKNPKLLGTDRRKMSKSYNNVINISDDPKMVRSKVMSMVTDVERPRREDPGHPENCNVFSWHQLFTDTARVAEIEKECRAATLSCGDDKKALADRILAWQEPILKRRTELQKDPGYVESVVRKGNEKARSVAEQTLKEVWEVVGFWPHRL